MPESGELTPNLCLDRGMMESEEDDHVMLMVPMEDRSYVPVIDGRVDGSVSMILESFLERAGGAMECSSSSSRQLVMEDIAALCPIILDSDEKERHALRVLPWQTACRF